METIHLHIDKTNLSLRTTLFCIKGGPINNLAPIKNCPVDAREAHWMPV